MEVVASHIGTDFDALAAMVACTKLHPGTQMILAGSQRPGVRQFIALHKDSLSLNRAEQFEGASITGLYLVDVSGCDRLGDAAWLGEKTGKITIYDHHPPFDQGGLGIRERLGAATTILVEQLQKAGIPVSTFEATLFLLGIYEDTHCLTNLSTTVRDMLAAAWLLEKGANLSEVSKYLNIPLSTEQRDLFEAMLGEANIEQINHRSVLITEATVEQFVGGLGRLTQRLVELEGCDLAVSIVKMENRVHLVARSLKPDLNLLEILHALGARGHASAVTLTIKDASPAELRRKLTALLKDQLPKGPMAADLMSAPVKSIPDDTSIAEAHRLLLRYGHTGMPVVNQYQAVIGIVSRRDVEKAMRHDLGHAPVRGYMTKNVISVEPGATIEEVTRVIIQNDIGRVPVLDKGRLVGIITRTDLLRQIHGDSAPRWHKPLFSPTDFRLAQPMEILTELINSRLPKRIQGILLLLGQKAELEGYKVYAVGGFVRDLILGVPNFDLDIAVEENALAFARLLPPLLGGKLIVHEEFGTATLTLPDGFQLDFATARMEFYQFPAASPEVEQTTIRHDLYRRDFTINTLAICLNSACFGKFLDFFGGYGDLKAGLIRVLYNLSFVEDPTRILRAVRFACRYGFALEEQTRVFLDTAVQEKMLAKIPDSRLGRELRYIFHEANVPALLTMVRELKVLEAVAPGLEWTDEQDRQVLAAAQVLEWAGEQNIADEDGWLIYPILLLKATPSGKRPGMLQKFGLTGKEQKLADQAVGDIDKLSLLLQEHNLSASEIYNILKPVPLPGLMAVLAANPHTAELRSRVLLYLEELADVEVSISGHDLKQLGVAVGPEMGRILKAVRRAKLDGEISTREEELALADKIYRKGE